MSLTESEWQQDLLDIIAKTNYKQQNVINLFLTRCNQIHIINRIAYITEKYKTFVQTALRAYIIEKAKLWEK